jgi:hypothetical protein
VCVGGVGGVVGGVGLIYLCIQFTQTITIKKRGKSKTRLHVF